ncbi:unknown [Prevotella sp. CAG:1031]|nr:unknown [Prevotella sp. CAG:1031]
MHPAKNTAQVEILKRQQLDMLPGIHTAHVHAVFFKPVKNPVCPAFIKNIRKAICTLPLQIIKMPLTGLPFPLTHKAQSVNNLARIALSHK